MARLASLGLLLLLLLTASQVSETSYQEGSEEDEDYSNDIPALANDKRASNLGTRFNLGKKFVGYRWIRSMESRQRRTPYTTYYRLQDYLRNNNVHWVRRY